MFPLPGLYLVPGTVVPLHIFEPRYRKLVDDLLDGPGRLVLATVVPGYEEDLLGNPPVRPVAGLGEIGRHERLPDGRYLILVIGLQRVHLREIESDEPYRQVEVKPLPEIRADEELDATLHEELVAAVRERVASAPVRTETGPKKIPFRRLGHAQLADLLLLHLELDDDLKFSLFAERDVAARARRCLEEHRRASG